MWVFSSFCHSEQKKKKNKTKPYKTQKPLSTFLLVVVFFLFCFVVVAFFYDYGFFKAFPEAPDEFCIPAAEHPSCLWLKTRVRRCRGCAAAVLHRLCPAATERVHAGTAKKLRGKVNNLSLVLLPSGHGGEALAGVTWCFMRYLTGAIWPIVGKKNHKK